MKKVLSLLLAAVIFTGLLSACGTTGSRGTADSVIKQLNQQVTELMKTTKSNYIFSEEFDADNAHYVVYEGKQYDSANEKEYTTKCSVIFEDNKFIGVKFETQLSLIDNYLYAVYSLDDIKEFKIEDIDHEKYLNDIKTDGAKIGEYEVYIVGDGSGETFKLIRSDSKIGIAGA